MRRNMVERALAGVIARASGRSLAIAGVIVATWFAPVLGQSGGPFDLTWNTLDGGGGTSSGGTFVLDGTFGQADAGEMAGGSFVLSGGFMAGQVSECVDAAQCDDGVFCTSDACDGGSCVNEGFVYGDVNDSGVVDLDDILCVIAGFGDFKACPAADIAGCVANGIIDLDDILAIIGAFGGDDPCCG